jgi:hypothetical protein
MRMRPARRRLWLLRNGTAMQRRESYNAAEAAGKLASPKSCESIMITVYGIRN